jgi:pSer/pThr/pTyr-binding forkhead associated (FHA) protein
MRVTLRKVLGLGIDEDVTVTASRLLIGRSSECDLRLLCPKVSRRHAELVISEGYVAVRDLNSRNGTFVNRTRVTGER